VKASIKEAVSYVSERMENLKRMSQISEIGETRKVQDGREMIK